MAIAQEPLSGGLSGSRSRSGNGAFPPAALMRQLSAIGRWFVGSGEGAPRGYAREGFPEIELHEIVAGRRERFDGLL